MPPTSNLRVSGAHLDFLLIPSGWNSPGLTESLLAAVELNSTSRESGNGWESEQNGIGKLASNLR